MLLLEHLFYHALMPKLVSENKAIYVQGVPKYFLGQLT